MRLVTFNCNFAKGLGLLQGLIDGGNDIICVQRFDADDIHGLRLKGMPWHFHTSFPHMPEYHRYGLLTIWAPWVDATARGIDLDTVIVDDDRFQGNSMVRLELGTHAVVNSLVGYPRGNGPASDSDADEWRRQVGQCLTEARDGRTVLVGDFHYEDSEPMWDGMNTGTMRNAAACLNTFVNSSGYPMSLDKIFVPEKVLVTRVEHSIMPFRHPAWETSNMHWPITMEYLP
jgi:hypothetical protein